VPTTGCASSKVNETNQWCFAIHKVTASSVSAFASSRSPPEGFRLETDSLGPRFVPKDALYGIHIFRAIELYDVPSQPVPDYPELVGALSREKKACAQAGS